MMDGDMNQRAATSLADLRADPVTDPGDDPALDAVAAAFRIRLSGAMRAAMTGPDDAIARQFLPDTRELIAREGEVTDPIGDLVHMTAPGLTHRYPDRVILAATHTCEVYCRFCFRREAVGKDGPLGPDDLAAAIAYIADHPQISEVILTGGDPLVLSPRRLADLVARLSAVPHVDIIRFHTRVPVVAPEKITDDLLAALQGRATTYVVVHTNHAAEITPAAADALGRLARAGIPLLSQSVLLAGINDDAATLEALFRTLVRHRVTPYYLHHCDLALGAGHFRTTIARGQAIMAQLRGRLSGICLPTYVLDIPGGFGKVPIGPAYLAPTGDAGAWLVNDWQGGTHLYRDPVQD